MEIQKHLLRRATLSFLFVSVLVPLIEINAQGNLPSPGYKWISGKTFVQSKNYYLLTLFNEIDVVKKLLADDDTLVRIAKKKAEDLSEALKTCDTNRFCYTRSMKFSEDEVKIIGRRLKQLYLDGNALEKLVKQHLIPSGAYILFNNFPPKELLVKAWEQDAHGINYAIDVYGNGNKPNYPNIDSISFNVNDKSYSQLLYNASYTLNRESTSSPLFFELPIHAALLLLDINERNQAADYEPMNEDENKAAYSKVNTVKWANYKYSVILIPGAGPDEPDVALSAEGMLRCRIGAGQYRKGMAPFIVVSGGKVHPYKTKYNEAVEMKRYLVTQLDIPESAIIIEPHARHTTTNMRNAARIIFRNGIPFNKPGLTCTTRFQSNMISNTLVDRCLEELHVAPYRPGLRLSESEVEFYPLTDALQINPNEPLDP